MASKYQWQYFAIYQKLFPETVTPTKLLAKGGDSRSHYYKLLAVVLVNNLPLSIPFENFLVYLFSLNSLYRFKCYENAILVSQNHI